MGIEDDLNQAADEARRRLEEARAAAGDREMRAVDDIRERVEELQQAARRVARAAVESGQFRVVRRPKGFLRAEEVSDPRRFSIGEHTPADLGRVEIDADSGLVLRLYDTNGFHWPLDYFAKHPDMIKTVEAMLASWMAEHAIRLP